MKKHVPLRDEIIVNGQIYKLSLEYILGFFEGDSSVTIQLKSNSTYKTGKQIVLIFEIHQHAIDVDLLKAISLFLGCGKVEIGRKVGEPESWTYRLRISTQTEILNVLLPILRHQSMVFEKRNHDLVLFIKTCLLVEDKKHTSTEGQKEIAEIASKFSSKLSLDNKRNLPETHKQLNAEWVTGITDAEGNFYFSIYIPKFKDKKKEVIFRFSITQENSEIRFLNNLIKFFGCGNVHTNNKGGGVFTVNKKEDLVKKIIPFFELNELQSIKQYSFLHFKKALKICINNKPLLLSHFEELSTILSECSGKRPKHFKTKK
jgi:intein-encoded DNA endonuclease-like protein